MNHDKAKNIIQFCGLNVYYDMIEYFPKNLLNKFLFISNWIPKWTYVTIPFISWIISHLVYESKINSMNSNLKRHPWHLCYTTLKITEQLITKCLRLIYNWIPSPLYDDIKPIKFNHNGNPCTIPKLHWIDEEIASNRWMMCYINCIFGCRISVMI